MKKGAENGKTGNSPLDEKPYQKKKPSLHD
jgi:hypothetical protein